ncbi:cation-translocating P-type ATPase [Haloarculaceae archaeon H-GB1-1]|nr:cation-translocating P-type ATPase [Haloarculaceae archaeon H-GB1-1]
MGCSLCDLPTPESPVTENGVSGSYCCRGCLEVAKRLDETDADSPAELDTGADTTDVEGETAYLSVEGMHCATCETFVESVASDREGVRAAEASYPADVLKVVYDDATLGDSELESLVDGMGYSVVDRDDVASDTETVGRLLVGGFFGMMTMMWYVLFLYPAYFGVDADTLLLDVHGSAGTYLLANIWLMATIVLGVTGYPVLRGAYVSLRAGEPNMDLLVALAASTAYVYSTVAALLGHVEVYFDVAVVIVLAVAIGNYYEGRVKQRATGALAELTEQRVETARKRTAEGHEEVPLSDLAGGDEVVVRPEERVPLDGAVVEGTAAVDESFVTGESVPVQKDPDSTVIGGARVVDGALVVRVDPDETSTLDRVTSRLLDIQSTRRGVQRLADKLAAVFVPLVLVLAVLTTGWHLLAGSTATAALLIGLTVLVVSCPCALGLATPLAVAAGVREALDRGVVVTNGSVFETATETDVVALDKTGTLTTGGLRLVGEHDESTLGRAAAVEEFADHPLAGAVLDAAPTVDATVTDFERHPGRGVSAVVDGEPVVVGRLDLFDERDWDVPESLRDRFEAADDAGRVAALVGCNGRARDVFEAEDTPRAGWETVLERLSEADREVVVITGDVGPAAERFEASAAVAEVFAGVPPEAKAEVVDRLRSRGTVAMVGDGSNDAPALAAADLGIALASGTKLAVDAADAVVTTGELSTVPDVFDLTIATRGRIRQNVGWAFLYNAVALPLALAGLLNPLFAAVAMATSSLLVVGNASRSLLE